MGTKTCKVDIKALKTLPQIECKLNVLKNGEVIAYKKRKNIEADLDYIILTNAKYKMMDFYGEHACFWGITEFPDKFKTTSELTTCFNMFDRCLQVKHIDLSHFDTSNVTNFGSMFFRCGSLESLNISYLDTSKATNMNRMFCGCDSLKTLDLSKFDTSNVTSMVQMLSCDNVENYIGIEKLNTSKVQKMDELFRGNRAVKYLDLSRWDVSNVTSMSEMFRYCEKLEVLDITGWNTSKVEMFNLMLDECPNLREVRGVIDLSSAKDFKITWVYEKLPKLEKPIKVKNIPSKLLIRQPQIEVVS